MFRWLNYLCTYLFSLQVLFVSAQVDQRFQYAVIDIGNGLNTNSVRDCIKDSRGFLWIATDIGITRYAYQQSIHLTKDPVSGKPLGFVNKLLLKDSLIYAACYSGLYKINIHTLRLERIEAIKEDNVEDLAFYQDQLLLTVTEGLLIFYDPKKGSAQQYKLTNRYLNSIVIKGEDLYCLSLETGFIDFDLKGRKLKKVIPNVHLYYRSNLYLSSTGDIYLINNDLIKRIDLKSGGFVVVPEIPGKTSDYTEVDGDAVFHIIDNRQVFYGDQGKKTYPLSFPVHGSTEFKLIKEGDDGQYYLISNQGLVVMRRLQPFKTFDAFKKGKNEIRRAIFEDTLHNRILFFSYDHISVFDQRTAKYDVIKFPSLSHAVLQDGDSLVIATEGSTLHTMHLGNLRSTSKVVKDGDLPLQFISLAKTPRGTYLLGTVTGFFITQDVHQGIRRVPLKYENADYTNMIVKTIWVRSDQEIWLGGSFGILVLNSKFEVVDRYSVSTPGNKALPTDGANCFYPVKEGLYAGLDGDLVFIPFDKSKIRLFYSPVYGKSANRIVSIVEDDNHDIWFASYQGIHRLNKKDSTLTSFHAPDYFSNDEFNFSAFCKTKSGKIYFGSIAEHVEIDPADYRNTHSPPTFQINSVKIFKENDKGETRYDVKSGDVIRLPIEGSSIDISFSLNDIFDIEKSNYQYRILNSGTGWIDLESRSSLQLFSLPSGKHEVEIRAVSHDGFMSDVFKLTLFVPALFYKTQWFNALLIFFIVFVAWIIYQIRVSNFKRIIKFRNELSADLHDTVGTSVTKTIYAAQSLQQESRSEDNRLQQIIENAKKIQLNFRDVLWSLEPNKDEIFNLFDRINDIGNSAVEHSRFTFTLKKDNVSPFFQLNNRQKREILLITREAIHNVIKHSNGDRIVFSFVEKAGSLVLIIADNGKNEKGDIHFTGQGLNSIQMRMKKIGGKVLFSKGPDGFTMEISF